MKGYIAFEDKNSNCQHDADEDLVSYTAVHSEVKQGKNIVCIGFASNGFRVPVGNVDALAARLRKLMEDDALLLRMKTASREHAGLFDLDAIAIPDRFSREAASGDRDEGEHAGPPR